MNKYLIFLVVLIILLLVAIRYSSLKDPNLEPNPDILQASEPLPMTDWPEGGKG